MKLHFTPNSQACPIFILICLNPHLLTTRLILIYKELHQQLETFNNVEQFQLAYLQKRKL
jgi:hypothetical protein